MNISITQHPTYIFTGPENQTAHEAINIMHNALCPENNCSTDCKTYNNLTQKKHPQLLWLTTDKSYVKSDMESIAQATTYKRYSHDYFFIVLTCAHLLNTSSAHTLLKLLEEPPDGYRFILTTQFLHHILPTIRSRSIIHYVNTNEQQQLHPLAQLLITKISPVAIQHIVKEYEQLTAEQMNAIVYQASEYIIKQQPRKQQLNHASQLNNADRKSVV